MSKTISITTDVDIDVNDFLWNLKDSEIIEEFERRNLDVDYLSMLDDHVIYDLVETRGLIENNTTYLDDIKEDLQSLMIRKEYKEILILLEKEIPILSGISEKVIF